MAEKKSITVVHPSKEHIRLNELETRIEVLEEYVRIMFEEIMKAHREYNDIFNEELEYLYKKVRENER